MKSELNVLKLLEIDDISFYDKFVSELPLEEQAKFFEEFPEFLSETQTSQLNQTNTHYDLYQKKKEM